MKLGLRLPQRTGVNLQCDIVEAAMMAEATGFASLWTYERLLYPVEPKEGYAYDQPDTTAFADAVPASLPWPATMRQAAESQAVLTAASVVTTKVRLGTGVLIAPTHAPFQLAKSLATIDQLSGGRLIAGIGSGWSTDEMQATGGTRADRDRFMDETLDMFEAVWGPDPVNYRGPRAVIENAIVLPKPVSKIPVIVGGCASTPRALERIAKRSDGWLSVPDADGIAETMRRWGQIRDLAAQYGRDADRLEHIIVANVTFTEHSSGEDRVPFVGTLDQVVADIVTAATMGADEVVIDLNLQDWFTNTGRMVETALEIYTRVTDSGI